MPSHAVTFTWSFHTYVLTSTYTYIHNENGVSSLSEERDMLIYYYAFRGHLVSLLMSNYPSMSCSSLVNILLFTPYGIWFSRCTRFSGVDVINLIETVLVLSDTCISCIAAFHLPVESNNV